MMVMLGTDAHKRSHTIVAVDPAGAEIGSVTVTMDVYGGLFSGFDEGVADAFDEAFSATFVSASFQKPTGEVIELPAT